MKFDHKDIGLIDQYKWYINARGYVVSTNQEKVYMHRLIMGNPNGCVDHINGDKSDNRRCNLRVCTQRENTMNSKISKNNTSGYKGVSWNKALCKWQAYIMVNYRRKHLGYHSDRSYAAQVYNSAAVKHFGEYAKLNEVT